jgi:hypothetical protein
MDPTNQLACPVVINSDLGYLPEALQEKIKSLSGKELATLRLMIASKIRFSDGVKRLLTALEYLERQALPREKGMGLAVREAKLDSNMKQAEASLGDTEDRPKAVFLRDEEQKKRERAVGMPD